MSGLLETLPKLEAAKPVVTLTEYKWHLLNIEYDSINRETRELTKKLGSLNMQKTILVLRMNALRRRQKVGIE